MGPYPFLTPRLEFHPFMKVPLLTRKAAQTKPIVLRESLQVWVRDSSPNNNDYCAGSDKAPCLS